MSTGKNSQNSDADHDNLLKSLESIKDLLVESEHKISAARESIALANASSPTKDAAAGTPADAKSVVAGLPDAEALAEAPIEVAAESAADHENLVPMLEDVVMPGASANTEPAPQELDVPLEEITAAEGAAQAPAAPSAQAAGRMFAELANNLENALHDALIQAVVQLETEFKHHVDEQISELRKQLGMDQDD
ncbi:MAG: hypothetical protein JSW10_02680 [Pseudomonadota bacterium]|nr:MAG: hypothetical protein JSW10_02680 [Pseudomonadota bacterium]